MDKIKISDCVLNSLVNDGIISPLLLNNKEFLIKSIEKGISTYERMSADEVNDPFTVSDEDYYKSVYLDVLKISLSNIYREYYDNLEQTKENIFTNSVIKQGKQEELPTWYGDFAEINITPPTFEERLNNLTLSEYNNNSLVDCFYTVLEKDGYLVKYPEIFDVNEEIVRQSEFLNSEVIAGHYLAFYGNAKDALAALDFVIKSKVPDDLKDLYENSLKILKNISL